VLRPLARLTAALLLLPVALPAQATILTAVVGGGESIDLGSATLPARVATGGPRLARALAWRTLQPGLASALVDLRAGTMGTPVQAIIVRVEPSRFRFALQHRTEANGMTGTWTIDSAGPGVAMAMNAGQFKETGPWGWLVLHGEERRAPLRAPLGIGIRIDTAGRVRWVPPGREPAHRDDRATAFAFQSFPLLFHDRRVPAVLRDRSLLDLTHRDARLVMAEDGDGVLLFVLTRYTGLGPTGERIPIGLTTPEAIALAAALGARHAVMLDGGISAQLLLRDAAGGETRWRGLRKVPLALVATPRAEH
jgi:hypothetical protein